MMILLTILCLLAGLVALVFILALFVRKDYSVQRSIIINRPKDQVFDYMKHVKNQDNYSTWVMMDPAMKKEFRGTDGTVGFVYAWNGNKRAGAGEQEIKNIVEGQRVDVEVRFIRPFAGVAQTPFTTETIDPNQTRVNWGMKSRMNYPMNVMLLLINMDKVLGKDLETSLQNLKGILEKR